MSLLLEDSKAMRLRHIKEAVMAKRGAGKAMPTPKPKAMPRKISMQEPFEQLKATKVYYTFLTEEEELQRLADEQYGRLGVQTKWEEGE